MKKDLFWNSGLTNNYEILSLNALQNSTVSENSPLYESSSALLPNQSRPESVDSFYMCSDNVERYQILSRLNYFIVYIDSPDNRIQKGAEEEAIALK